MSTRNRCGGFTLLEVMVALIITSIGLLGIAKIQALAYASTTSASVRSMVAVQAAGLASSMHANRVYWAAGAAPVPLTITGTVISDATLNGTATTPNYCVLGSGNTPCTSQMLAAFDLHTWAKSLNTLLGSSNPVTTISCPVTIPVNCTIQITWNERAVGVNAQSQAATTTTTFTPTYTLYVEP